MTSHLIQHQLCILKKMSSPVKLTYFNVTARAEPIRFLLFYGGVEFVDERLDRDVFVARKQGFPFGKVPVLEIDGMTMHQSVVICRYLGNKFGLVPKDPKDALQCEMLGDSINDIRGLIRDYYFESHPEAKEQKKIANIASAKLMLTILNDIVAKNGGHFVKELTWTDFLFAGQADNLNYLAGEDLYTDMPALRELSNKVRALPTVKKYLETCPKPLF